MFIQPKPPTSDFWAKLPGADRPDSFDDLNFPYPFESKVKGPHFCIRFTQCFNSSPRELSNISVVASLDNGREIARYSLSPDPQGECLQQVRQILITGPKSGLTSGDILRTLAKITSSKNAPGLSWNVEAITHENSGSVLTAPMRHFIPPFSEFVRNPSSIQNTLISHFSNDANRGFLKSHLEPGRNQILVELNTTEPLRKLEPFIISGASSVHPSTHIDLVNQGLRVVAYELHEILQEQGVEKLRQHLIQKQAPALSEQSNHRNEPQPKGTPRLAPKTELGADRVISLSSGARLDFSVNPEAAILKLSSGPDVGSTCCSWVFDGPWHQDSRNLPRLRQIERAVSQLASSDEREAGLQTLNSLRSWFTPMAGKLESIFSPETLQALKSIRGLEVSALNPAYSNDILDMCLGLNLAQIRLTNPRIRFVNPELFDFVRLAVQQDGLLREMHAFNHLQGRFDFVASPTIHQDTGDIVVNVARAMEAQTHRGRQSLQVLVQSMCALDPDLSLVSWKPNEFYGELPGPDDHRGQLMYDIGGQIVTAFARVNFSKPDNAKVSSLGDGRVAVDLGLDTDPYLMRLTLKFGEVSNISVYEQIQSQSADTVPSRRLLDSCDCQLSLQVDNLEDQRAISKTLELFNTLLREALLGEKRFDNSELKRFLDSALVR